MHKDLEDVGLSEKEARVYLASLEMGPATAEKLAKQAEVNRSTTYVQLESLMKKGLMSMHEEGKKTYFTPESPEHLKRMLSMQKTEMGAREDALKDLLPDLLEQYKSAGERPVVRFFPGKEGITAVREEILAMKEKKLSVLFASNMMSEIYTEKEADEYTKRREALNILSKAIYTDESFFKRKTRDKLTEGRYLPNMSLSTCMRLWDNKVGLFSLEGSVFAIVIESVHMANTMKKIFDFLWQRAQTDER